jgi:lipoprotein-anchoring transpeptidase ErfK/SrfK
MRGIVGRVSFRWRAALIVLGVVACASAVVAAYHVGSRRDVAMMRAADTARRAVADARTSDAQTWAPQDLSAAERELAAALTAQRLEETRRWPIPDSERVIALYASVEQRARRAETLTRQRSAETSAATAALIEEARAAVESSDTLAESIHLASSRRVLLAMAHTALTESSVYVDHGDFATATLRARRAIDLAGQVRAHAAAVASRYADSATMARWQRWRNETIEWSRREGRAAIVVSKEAHALTLYEHGRPVHTFSVELGNNWIADKLHAGDGATPEGRYRVTTRKGASAYYKALLLDYPNADDRAEFARLKRSGGVPRSAYIGGLIEIHGEGGRGRDWTRGCVALRNADLDVLWARVGVGTPVTIVGSDNYGAIAELGGQQQRSPAGR